MSIRANRNSPTTATTVEFNCAPKDPAPTDLVLELGRKQDTAIRGWQATQAATRCDAASPVVVAAFGSEHALQPGAIDPGQLVAHHLALGLQIVE